MVDSDWIPGKRLAALIEECEELDTRLGEARRRAGRAVWKAWKAVNEGFPGEAGLLEDASKALGDMYRLATALSEKCSRAFKELNIEAYSHIGSPGGLLHEKGGVLYLVIGAGNSGFRSSRSIKLPETHPLAAYYKFLRLYRMRAEREENLAAVYMEWVKEKLDRLRGGGERDTLRP